MEFNLINFNRDAAKNALAQKQLLHLSKQEKIEILQEYWVYETVSDIEDSIASGDLPILSEALIHTIATSAPPTDYLPNDIEPLLLDWLVFSLDKTLNEYIRKQLHNVGIECTVTGEVEDAGLCPCCNYYSIDAGDDGRWDICPVCYWENGGDGPNHMSIDEARANFRQFGAKSQAHLKNIDPEGPLKYPKKP